MSAELLREAATLMRKEARTEWMLVVVHRRTSCGAHVHHRVNPGPGESRRDPDHPKWCNAQPGGATQPPPSSEKLMRKTLLGVADLLDNTAGHIEFSGATEESEDVWDALVVARAYLGRET